MLVSLLVALTACAAPTPENFPDSFSNAFCQRLQDCAQGAFESEYDDLGECSEELAEDWEDRIDYLDENNCDFDADDAAECLHSLRTVSCKDFYELDLDGCDKISDCPIDII